MTAKSHGTLTADELRQKIRAGSQDSDDYINLANAAFESGCYDEAVSSLQRALNLSLTNFERARIHWQLAWLFYSLEKPEQALGQAEKTRDLLSRGPENPEVVFFWGTIDSLWAQCSTDPTSNINAARSALMWLNRLIAEGSNFENIVFAYNQAARMQCLLGNPQEAIQLCQDCLQKDLDHREKFDCLLELAEAYRIADEFAQAADTVAEASKYSESAKDRLPHLYFTLGLIQRGLSRPAEAREAFEKALLETQAQPHLPDNPSLSKDAYWNLGELYYELREYKKAVVTFQRLLALYPEDDLYRRDALVWLGQAYHEIENLTEATNCYLQVLHSPNASETEKMSVQQGLGKIFYDCGEYDEAITAFQKVVTYFTWNDTFYADVLLWLGDCYYAKGDHEHARDCYEEVQTSPQASKKERKAAEECLARLPQAPKRTLQ